MKKFIPILFLLLTTNACEGKILLFGDHLEDTFVGTTIIGEKDPDVDPKVDPKVDPLCIDCSGAKRLTQTEFQRSVVLILGSEMPDGRFDYLPSDGKTGPFRTNNAAIDIDGVEAYRTVAEDIAARFVKLDKEKIGCDLQDETCPEQILDRVAPLFYRRPVSDDEKNAYKNLLQTLKKSGSSVSDRVRVLITAFLQTPAFIYKIEKGEATDRSDILKLGPYELATRMSYFLWKSGPDKKLLDAVENGDLDSEDGILKEAQRMLNDKRAQKSILQFHREWLGIDELLTKNIEDEDYMKLRVDMLKETEGFVLEVFKGDSPTLNTLLTSKTSTVSAELAAFYGATQDAEGKITREGGQAGVLTQGSFLAAHSSEDKTTAIYRGLSVMENIACVPRRPPSPINNIIAEDPKDSFREQLSTITSPTGCQGCHKMMNSLGFGFGHYDKAGRYREMDNGHPVDASGTLFLWADPVEFDGPEDLARILTARDEIHECLTKSWFEYALGRRAEKADAGSLLSINQVYNTSGKDIREMMISIISTPSFRHRRLPEKK